MSVENVTLEPRRTLRPTNARPVSPPISEFSAPLTFARDDPPMSDATATPEVKPHASLFTRLRVVEAELYTLKALFAHLKEDHEALRARPGPPCHARSPMAGSRAPLSAAL